MSSRFDVTYKTRSLTETTVLDVRSTVCLDNQAASATLVSTAILATTKLKCLEYGPEFEDQSPLRRHCS